MYSYKRNTITKTSIRCNESQPGERIEEKIERLLNNKEPIRDTAPQVFTDRQDGVKPEYDIRTDKWEEAASADRVLAEVSILNQGTRLTVQEVYDNNALQLQNRMMAAPYSLTDSIVGGTIIIRVYSKP